MEIECSKKAEGKIEFTSNNNILFTVKCDNQKAFKELRRFLNHFTYNIQDGVPNDFHSKKGIFDI